MKSKKNLEEELNEMRNQAGLESAKNLIEPKDEYIKNIQAIAGL